MEKSNGSGIVFFEIIVVQTILEAPLKNTKAYFHAPLFHGKMGVAIQGRTMAGTIRSPQAIWGYPLQAQAAQIGSRKIQDFGKVASR